MGSPRPAGGADSADGTSPRRDTGVERRQVYGLDTRVVRYSNAEFYVPDYAIHRPVSQKVLRKRKVSGALHKFVGRYLARRPGSMVHAGTFFGDMLPSFSRKTPGTVHAFEPVLENFLLAHAVVETNGLENVRLVHCGLGASAGVATIGVAWVDRNRHMGGAARILTDEPEERFETQLTPVLDLDGLGIEDLSLIQLDTEGFELPILQGAATIIRSQSPAIVVEDNTGNCRDFLAELDYEEAGRLRGDVVYTASARADEVAGLLRPGPDSDRTG